MTDDLQWKAQDIDLARVGIETTYAGVRFRSRLEARWAAMFDLLKWHWDYEPIDLSEYVPDFVLHMPRAPLLVEVKPALSLAEYADPARKVCLSGWRRDFMVVGSSLPRTSSGEAILGRLWYWEPPGGPPAEWDGGDSAVAHRCTHCRALSAHQESGGWQCLVCGFYDGVRGVGDASAVEVDTLWREAGNRVQWRKA